MHVWLWCLKQDDEYYLTSISRWLLFILSFQRTILDKILEHVGVNWWKVKTSEQLCKKEKSYMCTWTIGDLGEIVLRCKWETNSFFKAKLIVLYFIKIIPSFHNFLPHHVKVKYFVHKKALWKRLFLREPFKNVLADFAR